ncbi:ParA family protein [Sesbania bispinosa]|nr:ParA family protein [Sesbania bispinosa]
METPGQVMPRLGKRVSHTIPLPVNMRNFEALELAKVTTNNTNQTKTGVILINTIPQKRDDICRVRFKANKLMTLKQRGLGGILHSPQLSTGNRRRAYVPDKTIQPPTRAVTQHTPRRSLLLSANNGTVYIPLHPAIARGKPAHRGSVRSHRTIGKNNPLTARQIHELNAWKWKQFY